jgi:hypothetical protein
LRYRRPDGHSLGLFCIYNFFSAIEKNVSFNNILFIFTVTKDSVCRPEKDTGTRKNSGRVGEKGK